MQSAQSRAKSSGGRAIIGKISTTATVVGVGIWIGAILWGMNMLWGYSFAPGEDTARHFWPETSALQPAGDRPTLVAFVHPRCPCSVASLDELEEALIDASTVLTAPASEWLPKIYIVSVLPADAPQQWRQSALIDHAGNFFGNAEVVEDTGAEAAAHGAETSGVAYLYGPDGKIWFYGGLTVSRGHHGDSAGKTAVKQLLVGYARSPAQTIARFAAADAQPLAHPVFGCRVQNSEGGD